VQEFKINQYYLLPFLLRSRSVWATRLRNLKALVPLGEVRHLVNVSGKRKGNAKWGRELVLSLLRILLFTAAS
jgi:hypothetical protein